MTGLHDLTGESLADIRTPVPGARSRELAQRLRAVESRNITCTRPEAPIFWQDARGANVRDVDGNIYIDLTSGFGVALAGHSNPRVARAIAEQAAQMAHALGDVHPAGIKVRLLEKLAAIAPAGFHIAILANTGAEAVEAALKTAVLRTGRAGVIAFEGAYHGLTYGALAATERAHFRAPFEQQLFRGVRFAPFASGDDVATALRELDRIITQAEDSPQPIGAIIVEPIQGRGGMVMPAPNFLPELRRRCDGSTRVLIFDEVYTGCGRTGEWFGCQHFGVVPDLLVIGKALSGALPIAAAIGSEAVMSSWPESRGEAIHTSTFLGNPTACAAALAQLTEIEPLLPRVRALGARIHERAQGWRARGTGVREVRGLGLLQGIVVDGGERAHKIMRACLSAGVLLLTEGADSDVLAITPPAVITEQQLDHALDVIERALSA